MTLAGVTLLRFIGSLEQSAAAQGAYAIGYTELFSLITWASVGLMGAAATIPGQNLRDRPPAPAAEGAAPAGVRGGAAPVAGQTLGAGHPDRAVQGVNTASRIGLLVAAGVGFFFIVF